MSEPTAKPKPWMIAAWPGMGNVALIAAGYLVQQLEMQQGDDLPQRDHFDVAEVAAKDGIVAPVRLPRGIFFRWTNPGLGRDLVVFISEAQPSSGSIAYTTELLAVAAEMGVERVVTFASLASGLHPSENPKVSGVATDRLTLDELRRAEVESIPDGEIGGMNGLLIGVAAGQGMAGMCLLAEIPFFAMRVPNPKAARAALSVFSVLAGIDISLEAIDKQAAFVDRALIEAMEQLEAQAKQEEEESQEKKARRQDEPSDPSEPPTAEGEIPLDLPPAPVRARDGTEIDPASIARLEQLFEEAKRNPSEAVKLKAELDRLGVFKRYEGRFLDLFRRAG